MIFVLLCSGVLRSWDKFRMEHGLYCTCLYCRFDLIRISCCLHFVLIERIKIQVESDGSGIVLRQNLAMRIDASRLADENVC